MTKPFGKENVYEDKTFVIFQNIQNKKVMSLSKVVCQQQWQSKYLMPA